LRALAVAPVVAFALAAIAWGCPAFALPAPQLAARLGRTFAVSSPTEGWFDQGGFEGAISLLWPWEDRFRFGVLGAASDLGSVDREHALGDHSSSSVLSVGHRTAWLGAWRVDALGPRVGRLGRSYATGHYGFVRFSGDRVNNSGGLNSAMEGTLGVGLERPLAARHTIGLALTHTWMSDSFSPRFASGAFEWRWRF
jgi:hypothetical protein